MRSMIVVAVLTLSLAGLPAVAGATGEPLAEVLGNLTYTGFYDEPVKLTDGFYQGETFVEGDASRPTVTMQPYGFTTGDLNGDGVEDAIVLLDENSGGSGRFTYVAGVLSVLDSPATLPAVWIGDRNQVKSMAITGGQAVLEVITQGPQDGACCPTLKVRKTYALQAGLLAEVGSEELGTISAADLNGTSWRLVDLNLDQQPVLADTEPTLSFQDGQVSGSGGCNTFTGSFSLGAENPGNLTIGPLASTMMACPQPIMDQETAYLQALGAVASWGYQAGGHLSIAYLPAPDALPQWLLFAPQMTGGAATAETLTAGTWQWVRLTDPVQQFDVEVPASYTLSFNADGSLAVKADCNNSRASYTADGGQLTIQIGPMTKAMCPPGSRSDEFVQKLGFAAGFFFQDAHLFIDLMADGGTLEFSLQ